MNNSLTQKLKSGLNIYGTCIVSTSPVWSNVVVNAGLDFVFIDTEHIPIERGDMATMCHTYKALKLPAIVRIPEPDPYLACMAKDAGALGVIAPYVESVNQVRDLVGAVKYRPLKGDRLKQILYGNENPAPELQQYLDNYNAGSICIINIESSYALENLDSLLDVAGLDGIIIGPHDLSINMGLPEQYDHPGFEQAVREIIRRTRAKGLSAGIHFPAGPERQIKWMREGVNIVLHSSDMFLFRQKLREDMALIKSAAGDTIDKAIGTEPAI